MSFDINAVYTATTFQEAGARLGQVYVDGENEYIFLKGITGVTSTTRMVTYTNAYVTALLTANAIGPVAVFMADVDANTKFGWAQIKGSCPEATSDAIATNAALYIDATAGRVDDAAVTGDLVVGIVSRSTDASTNIFTAQLNYPFVTDVLG